MPPAAACDTCFEHFDRVPGEKITNGPGASASGVACLVGRTSCDQCGAWPPITMIMMMWLLLLVKLRGARAKGMPRAGAHTHTQVRCRCWAMQRQLRSHSRFRAAIIAMSNNSSQGGGRVGHGRSGTLCRL